jgi:hypothetical protein
MVSTFTPTTNAEAIPTIIAMEVIKQLPANLGLTKFVSKDTDWTGQDFATQGDTLNIVKPGSLTARKKTAGTAITVDNATATKMPVTLSEHAYISVLQEDITKLLQKPDLQAAYAQRMAITLAEQVESDGFALHPSITNTVTFSPVTTEAEIDSAYRRLRTKFARLKVPQTEQKVAFLDTSVIDKLLSVQKYTSTDYVNAKGIVEGAVNRIHGVNNFESQLIRTSGSPVAYHNIATTKWGMVVVSRPMPLDGNGRGVKQYVVVDPGTGLSFRITEGYDMQNMGVQMTIDLLYGWAIADANQVVEVESF